MNGSPGSVVSSVIAGAGMYVPERVLTSEEVEDLAGYKRLKMRNGFIRMVTGVAERRYAAPDEHCSDIAANAAREALASARMTANDLDAVVFCAVTQDFAEPATASVILDKLGARRAFAFDVKNACNALLSAMDIADSLIRTGKAATVLVVSGEALSRWIKFDYDDVNELRIRTPVTLSLGDGGGAFILTRAMDGARGIRRTAFHTFGELWNNNVMWGGGVIHPRDPEKMYIPGTTKELVDKHVDMGAQFIRRVVEETGWTIDSVALLVGSQVAKWITDRTAAALGLSDEQVVKVLHKWGNVGAANIPLAACEAVRLGRLRQGDRVVFYGGAVGFSVGCITLTW